MNEKIIVAMSGGVDSSVTAGLLVKQGYDVTGINIRTWKSDVQKCDNFKSCCSPEDINDARDVAMRLGIPFYSIPMEDLFYENVISPFIQYYKNGLTPNPCVNCNNSIKFGELLKRADKLGIDKVATGHFANIVQLPNQRYAIASGKDTIKNQAYYLYGLSQDNLRRTVFPLGNLNKAEVRNLAREMGLAVAEKNESQEICFIPDNDYRKFLQRENVQFTPGRFLATDGTILGKHDGKEKYTIGQRKGLGISWKNPLYVLKITENDVIVGEENETFSDSFMVKDLNAMGLEIADGETTACRVQIRYKQQPVHASAQRKGNILYVYPKEPLKSVTPGQSAVFYHQNENYILFGGTIL